MIDKNDWRLTNQMKYLFEKKLLHTKYTPFREGWEHDHCEFCSETINQSTDLAYCTTDKYHWICKKCFNDFKEMFKWEVTE